MPINNIQRHKHTGLDSPKVNYDDLENLPSLANLNNAPLTKVDSPSGGTNIDPEARSAIDSLITRLEDLGLIAEN